MITGAGSRSVGNWRGALRAPCPRSTGRTCPAHSQLLNQITIICVYIYIYMYYVYIMLDRCGSM